MQNIYHPKTQNEENLQEIAQVSILVITMIIFIYSVVKNMKQETVNSLCTVLETDGKTRVNALSK